MNEETYRNILLPILGFAETVLTKGKSPGTTAIAQEQIFRQNQDRKAQAVERAAETKRADALLKLQEGRFAREKFEGDRKLEVEDDARHEALVAKDKALARILGRPSKYDEATNTVTMGQKGLDLTPTERAYAEVEPIKFLEGKMKNPLAEFMAKWDYQVENPKPTAPKGGKGGSGVAGGGKTIGEQAVDKAFAKEYESFVTGGFADAEKGITQLRGIQKQLEGGAQASGAILGRTPDFAQSVFNPKALDLREQVEEVVQRNLRLILGAQFTQSEGDRLIKRAYNQSLDEKANAARLNRLIKQMEDAYAAKYAAMKHWEEKGTLKGFDTSKLVRSVDDFNLDDAPKKAPGQALKAAFPPSNIKDPKLLDAVEQSAQGIPEDTTDAKIAEMRALAKKGSVAAQTYLKSIGEKW